MKILLFEFLITLLLTACAGTKYLPNDVSIYETKTNLSQRNYNKILIGGTGPNSLRLFIENLSEKLYIDFNEAGIQSKYFYLGNDPEPQDSNFTKITGTEYFDAYLLFSQKDLHTATKSNPPIHDSQLSDIKRDQLIEIKLFDSSNTKKSIWEANMRVNINPANDRIYSNISALIFKRLKENKILK